MRKFEVGDRVRVVYTFREKRNLGAVTTILSYDAQDGTYELDIPRASPFWKNWWALPSQLEPVYDGHEPVSWSSCIWRPKVVEA